MPAQGCSGIIEVTWFGTYIRFKKILNNVFSGTASLIDMKLHNCDLVVMGNTCCKFQLDQSHGLAARII